ncbi:ABC transporter ATP-binding protein [Cognatishimia maritima]|uniref:ATP-binding cassette, subfamily B n=1 Tax=Cognatishimia maritima TaxID=870908 RepID=A0A1M5PAJ0_9RHOB|nr:ABC transporter ATP-binding protein [Cognatishimia maritima]SHG98854.1 ATP-binding cassette, subfamily B [Cognatishimia maritima]
MSTDKRNAIVRYFGDLIDPARPAKSAPPATLGRFLVWVMDGFGAALVVAFVGYALAGFSEAYVLYLLGQILDLTLEGPENFFANNGGLLLFAGVFLLVFRPLVFAAASLFQSVVIAPNLHNRVVIRLNRYTTQQPIQFFDDDFAGRIAQKQLQTGSALTAVVTDVINAGTFSTSTFISMLALGSLIDPVLGAIVLGWIAAYVLLLRYFLPRVRARSKTRANARAGVTGQIVDTAVNMRAVKLFATSEHEDQAVLAESEIYRQRGLEWAQLAVGMRASMILLAGILPVLMVGAGLLGWQSGRVTTGELATLGAMAIRLAQMTGWVSWTLMSIFGQIGEVEDGIRTLARPLTLQDRLEAQPLAVNNGEVRFEDVSFAYGSEAGGVFGVSLTIKAGEKVGVVGASGAGKSTLVSLLLRLYDPESGRILIDGQDIAGVTQDSLRRQVGMVTQDTATFNRSAFDNIRYGRPEATQAEVLAATKKARADGFVADLQDPNGRNGFDAHLGERGVKLSGGQRQRIALARAILKDAPILVLDEATSALDSEVEAEIQAALHEVVEGKTVIAIAHRLSTIAEMDRIVVMDQGQIVEDGSHHELLAQDGLYAGFWRLQSGGFLGSEAAE